MRLLSFAEYNHSFVSLARLFAMQMQSNHFVSVHALITISEIRVNLDSTVIAFHDANCDSE